MQFAEYWRTEAGGRVFDVHVNGNEIPECPVDIFAAVGPATAYTITWSGVVPDGLLAIDFVAVVSNPMLSGLVVEQAPPYAITSPRGGESYAVGQQIVITWSTLPVVDNAMVEISPDEGETWHLLNQNSITPDDTAAWEHFPFVVPAQLGGQSMVSDRCLVRIRDYDNLHFVDCPGLFSITASDAVAAALPRNGAAATLRVTTAGSSLKVCWPGVDGMRVTALGVDGRVLYRSGTLASSSCDIPLRHVADRTVLLRVVGPGRSQLSRIVIF
jgi:hypothetical protein